MAVAAIVISILLAVGLIVFFVGRAVRQANAPEGSDEKRRVSFKAWLINRKPNKRRLIQVYAALLYNANVKGFITGNIYSSATTKYMCVPGLNCYSCPGAVGACPLGAMQNALSESGTRAPYYVIGIIVLFGLTVARAVCGFLCPVGLFQELVYKIRTPKLGKSAVTRVLSYFKYVLLALAIALPLVFAVWNIPLPAFCKYICPAGTLGGAVMLLINPNNAGMFAQLGWLFTWKLVLLVVFVTASIFVFRFFCRFFCPLGAIYGFFNKFALIGVTVDKSGCTDCGLCVRHCKMDVKRVGDHECINCGECMAVCPTKAISWKGSKLFLRAGAAELGETIKPLAVRNGAVKIETPSNAANDNVVNVVESAKVVAAETAVQPVKQKRAKSFWFELAAWVAAGAVLLTALVCYNFVKAESNIPITPDTPNGGASTGYNVGDIAPDFTVKLYGKTGEFNLYAHRGKVTIVNFWATWCTPCVEEIPHFGELAKNHPELNVVAVHGLSSVDIEKYIKRKGWTEYEKLIFAQDNLDGEKCLSFAALGGRDGWPITVIVDKDGKIIYRGSSFASYEQLETLVNKVIADAASGNAQ